MGWGLIEVGDRKGKESEVEENGLETGLGAGTYIYQNI